MGYVVGYVIGYRIGYCVLCDCLPCDSACGICIGYAMGYVIVVCCWRVYLIRYMLCLADLVVNVCVVL